MTLEIIDESDVIRERGKEKKHELRLVDDSEIKKVGSEKKSWLSIIKDEVREDPKIELVSKSDTIKKGEPVKKRGLEFVARERIVNCERQKDGLTNNCAICKELTIDRFNRCPNKYGGFQLDNEHIDEIYCPELGDFCNGTMGCIDCPYRDEKLRYIMI